ncbi:uncharacterized protein LOC105663529 [Megachile rotundata]|uniref:uncharacterized protein LOC105663529 n=1 Tax=Megachile rotundata TaxID=143995 RepID=UPI003FD59DA8
MEILRGKRKNSFVCIYEGYSYSKDSKNPKIYRCSCRQTQQCTGTVVQRNEQFFIQKPHTHPNNPQCAEVLKLKSMMLKECKENPCINNKDIFDNICRLNPDAAAYISYNSMKSIMSREKAKSRPPLPKTVQSAHEMLENYDVLKDIYQGCTISTENKYALIFSNSALLSALESAKEIYMDGTFSVVPQIPAFQQLYTIHIRYNDTGIATIFALCECRTLSMYKAIWTKIASLAPGLQHNLKTVMCDYEKASMEAIRIQFPAVTIHGCWFHFNQALLRKWKKLGLEGAQDEILSMAMTMPLAPPDMFPQALNEIQLVADRSAATFPNVLQFMEYLQKVWLPIATKVSVYGSAVRTNNLVESFHSAVIRKLKIVHPNFWLFIDNLTKLIADQETNYKRLLNNEKIRSIRRRTNMAKNNKIRTAQDNLMSGILPLDQFLRLFSKDHKQEQYESNLMLTENICTVSSDEHNELLPEITFFAEEEFTAFVKKPYKNQETQTTSPFNTDDCSGITLARNNVSTQNMHGIITNIKNEDCQKREKKEIHSSNMSPQIILENICTANKKSMRTNTRNFKEYEKYMKIKK